MNQAQQAAIENDPVFVERLRQETLNLLILRTKYLLGIAILLYPAYWALDWVTEPSHSTDFLIIRLFVAINYMFGLLLLSSEKMRRFAFPLTIWETYVSILGVVIMTAMLDGFASFYYIGIIFILFVAGLFFPWSVLHTIISGVLSISTYVIVNLFFSDAPIESIFIIAQPVFFMAGAVVISAFGNVGDVRTRKNDLRLRMQVEKANEDLKELDQAKTRFFSNVSHELRSPLTLIFGPLEDLLQSEKDPDNRRLLQAMEANARRLLRQVNTLLDFAKIDASKLECQYAYANVGEILRYLVVAATPHAESRGIELIIEGHKSIPDTVLDPDKFETVCANLISNAIKFTPSGGNITITLKHDADRVWFHIVDTGPGIPKDKLDSIFERFLQIDDSFSRSAEGTGLGLAMVKELTRLHNGKVTVDSKMGQGTDFRVEIPKRPSIQPLDRRRIIGRRREDQLAQARTATLLGVAFEEKAGGKVETLLSDIATAKLSLKTGAESNEPIVQMASADAPKVLIVEDNPDLRSFMTRSLNTLYRLENAGDGIEGLEKARSFLPDLIISDIMMPRMDGYEFTRNIREDASLERTPIILVTAKSGGEAVVEGFDVGANDYLPKPFEVRELKARVAAHLKTHSLEKNLNERESRLSAIGKMTSSIVHDLRNPLTAIIGFAEIAKQDASEAGIEEVSEDMDPILSESNRLARMITEVLDFAKGRASDLDFEAVRLVPFVESICSVYRAKLSPLGIRLDTDHAIDDKIRAMFDEDRMQRVLENLIKNAQEALCSEGHDPEGKRILVTTSADDRSVVLKVTDEGPGIPNAILPNLFEPFATGKKTGTGLGLATVRNLVIAHGGEINVLSNEVEGGATFIMRFPRIDAAPS
jgi:signal transduction histidine kinase